MMNNGKYRHSERGGRDRQENLDCGVARTPAWGLLICFFIEVFFLLVTVGGYGALVSVISVAFMVAYALGPVSFGVLRVTAPEVERPFRLRGGGFWSPLASVLASMLLYWSRWPLTGETLGVLFLGAIVNAGYALAGRAAAASIRQAE